MWKKCKRYLSHIIITLHSVSKKPTIRKSVLGIWGTLGYMRTKRNLSVSARLSDFLVYKCLSKSLTILCSCILSFVMSSPFRILFQSFLFLESSERFVYILKKQSLLVSLILCYFFSFYFIYFHSVLCLPYINFGLGMFLFFWFLIRLLIWEHSFFLMYTFIVMNFPLFFLKFKFLNNILLSSCRMFLNL